MLSPQCPLDIRKLIAGQHNASGRLIRTTTIAELMTMMYNDESAADLNGKILRSLERSGMNLDVNKPVCSPIIM